MFAGSVPMIGTPSAFQRQRQRERRLTAELHDHAVRFLGIVDVQHLFERQRLEVQAVAGVVIRGDSLRIAVHHDRLVPEILQRERRVAAAVIELDSLPDAVRAAAENHDLLAIARIGFRLRLVARIQVRREALELRGAGVHAVEHRRDSELLAAFPHVERIRLPRAAQASGPRCRRASQSAASSREAVSSDAPATSRSSSITS